MCRHFVALDFETANRERSSACCLGLVQVFGGKVVAAERRFINPSTYFLEGWCRDVHKIWPEDVEAAPSFGIVWKELSPLLEGAEFIAAHNAHFDKSFLYTCCEGHKVKPPSHRFVCTMKAARACWKLPSYALDTVCEHLGIRLKHHDALSDAKACAQILLRAVGEGYKVQPA